MEKYGCSIVSSKDHVDNNPNNFFITSKCGHESKTSYSGLSKRKRGVYCNDCLEEFIENEDEITCCNPKCNNTFVPTKTLFVYCSKECSQSRIIPDEQRERTRNTIYKNLGYVNNDGNILDRQTVKNKNSQNKFLYNKTEMLCNDEWKTL